MFQAFLAPFLGNLALNTLLTGKFDPMKSAINTATGQITGNLLNNIIPSNVLNSGGGILDTVGGGGSAGMIPNTVDTANLPLAMTTPAQTMSAVNPDYMASQFVSPYTTGFGTPRIGGADLGGYDMTSNIAYKPDFNTVVTPEPQDVATVGGYEDKPLYQRAYDKVANYITENPVEAGMLGLMGGSAVYQGLNPRQQRVPLTQVTSSVKQATAPQFGSPLKIRRPGMRG